MVMELLALNAWILYYRRLAISMKKKVLIISISPLHRDPRILRQIIFLREKYDVYAMGLGSPGPSKMPEKPIINRCEVPEPWWVKLKLGFLSEKETIANLFLPSMAVLRYFTYRSGWWDFYYEKKYWMGHYNRRAREHLKKTRYDFILANDTITLPLAVSCSNGAKIIFDSHEYAPEQSRTWDFRLSMKPYFHYMLKHFAKKADAMTTVSPGFIERFKREYDLDVSLMTNAPFFEDIPPSPVLEGRIRMVHHGFASPQRHTARMVELMSLLDNRFELDFMLIDANRSYLEGMKKMAKGDRRIRFVPPVPTLQISKAVNKYDIGLYALYPTCYNAVECLPNKFFEFVNGSLALAITPVKQMAKLVSERKMGVVGENMSLKSLADALNGLTTEELEKMKRASYEAGKEMNAQRNGELLRSIFTSVDSK